MKKFLFSVCLSLLGVHALAAAAPFALTTDTRFNHLTHKILAQEPIYFYLNDETFEEAFYQKITEWFSFPLHLCEVYPQEGLRELLPYLQHGKNRATYIRTDSQSQADLYIYVESDKNKYHKLCRKSSLGCLKANNTLYLLQSADRDAVMNTLQHELGHAFGLEDLYGNQYPSSGPTYGSGIQKSIMHHETYLTCDDADGIVNSLWLALKHKNPDTPDFHFHSFCNSKRTFQNSYMTDRKPAYVDFQHTRTAYTYCTNGKPHHIVSINPKTPENLVKIVQAPIDCSYTQSDGNISQQPVHIPTLVKDMPAKNLSDQAKFVGQEIYKHFLLDGNAKMSLTFVLNTPHIPAYVYLQEEKNENNKKFAYLFAYLENGYNMAHQFSLSDFSFSGPTGDLFIYKRENPKVFCAWGSKTHEGSAACVGSEQEKQEMLTLLEKNYRYFKEEIGLPESRTGWQEVYPYEGIPLAQKWEKLLLDNYTSMFVLQEQAEQRLKTIVLK